MASARPSAIPGKHKSVRIRPILGSVRAVGARKGGINGQEGEAAVASAGLPFSNAAAKRPGPPGSGSYGYSGHLGHQLGTGHYDCRPLAVTVDRPDAVSIATLSGKGKAVGASVVALNAVPLRLGQHHGVAPLIHDVGHRHPAPAVVAGAVGVLDLGAPGHPSADADAAAWLVAASPRPAGAAPRRSTSALPHTCADRCLLTAGPVICYAR